MENTHLLVTGFAPPSARIPEARAAPWYDLERLRTGDLMFFHGDAWTSHLIEWSGSSPWSHVALVVRFPVRPDLGALSGRLCLWEAVNWHANETALSTEPLRVRAELAVPGEGPYKARVDEVRGGVRLVDLRARVGADHAPYVGVLHLTGLESGSEAAAQLQRRVERYIGEHDENPYLMDYWMLVKSWWDALDSWWCCGGLSYNPPSEARFFCSQLVAATFQAALVLKRPQLHVPLANQSSAERRRSNREFTVADFAFAQQRLLTDLLPPFGYETHVLVIRHPDMGKERK